MGNKWFVSSAAADTTTKILPSPDQVLAAVGCFPEYRVSIRRRDRKEKGQAVYIELRREDGSAAVDIHLLRVSADDRPVGVFVFDYFRGTDELVRLVTKLAESCGPLVLWDESGEAEAILVTPAISAVCRDRGDSSE